mgnify:CR=1 FL=1|jgi:hypothetical protein
MKLNLRLLYLYLFSFVGLIITVIASIGLLDLALETYVFRVEETSYYQEPAPVREGEDPKISQEEFMIRQKEDQSNQRKRKLSNSLASIMVGAPLYLYHWKTIKKEQKS